MTGSVGEWSNPTGCNPVPMRYAGSNPCRFHHQGLAQSGRAPHLECGGRWFEPSVPDQSFHSPAKTNHPPHLGIEEERDYGLATN